MSAGGSKREVEAPLRQQPSDRPAVLVIDDSDVDRETMADILIRSGFDVHELPSPIGATRVAKDLQVRVVVIDQNLPAMDGSKLAALFRNNPAFRGIRLVLVSGNDERAMAEITEKARADAFVSKRRIHQDLATVVKRLAP
jgi:CheY-like chemotaxis protein